MTVQEALDELLRVSSDVTHAAVLDGENVTVAGADQASAASVAAAADALWQAASRAAIGHNTGHLDQLVVEAGEGATFMVVEGARRIVAVSGRRPVPGLVFYDLRTCLRDAFGTGEAA